MTGIPARSQWRALLSIGVAGLAASLLIGGIDAGAATRPTAATEKIQILRVDTPTRAAKTTLTGLDLDLTEAAGPTHVDVVSRGQADLAKLREAGLRWTVIDPDVAKTEAEREEADRRYARSKPATTLPSGRTAYRTLADYDADLAALATKYPATVRGFTLNHPSLEGRGVHAIEVSHDVASTDDGKPTFLIMGLHHAREWPSGELTIEFAYDLLQNDGTDARITGLLDKARIVFVPVVNPDGFHVSRSLAYEYKRKNCRLADGQTPAPEQCAASSNSQLGTDPNRNYGGFWGGPGASTDKGSQTYRGAGPFSEPETRNIQELVSTHQVTTLITNHTYSNLVLRPPGYASAEPTPDEAIYKALGDAMAAQTGYTSEYGYQLYDTTGTTEDWSYYATGGLAYTFEHGANGFHPAFSNVVNYYFGSGKRRGKGSREAFLLALENTADAARHSVVTGTAPAGAVLRLKKQFDTATWNGATFPDTLETTITVPTGGTYTWHTNPSTRPIAVQQGKTESWTLTCERPDGTVLETQQVTVDRGASATANLTQCAAAYA
ncbi:MAG: M14 family metallopeptidase [Micromonosporaceae bacterium]